MPMAGPSPEAGYSIETAELDAISIALDQMLSLVRLPLLLQLILMLQIPPLVLLLLDKTLNPRLAQMKMLLSLRKCLMKAASLNLMTLCDKT